MSGKGRAPYYTVCVEVSSATFEYSEAQASGLSYFVVVELRLKGSSVGKKTSQRPIMRLTWDETISFECTRDDYRRLLMSTEEDSPHLKVTLCSLDEGARGINKQATIGKMLPIDIYDFKKGFIMSTQYPSEVRSVNIQPRDSDAIHLNFRTWIIPSVELKNNLFTLNLVSQSSRAENSNNTWQDHDFFAEAKKLGISDVKNIKNEAVLWIIKESLECPLPPYWTSQNHEDGSNLYIDNLSGRVSFQNPKHVFYRRLLKKELDRGKQGVNFDAETTQDIDDIWIPISVAKERYYLNTKTGERIQRTEEATEFSKQINILKDPQIQAYPNRCESTKAAKIIRKIPVLATTNHLVFNTWWKQGSSTGMKRYTTTITYNLETCNFKIKFDDSHDPVTLSHVNGRHGQLERWDLYVDARICLLNRTLHLKQANRQTMSWLDYHGKQFSQLRSELIQFISKYDHSMRNQDYNVTTYKDHGRTNLRRMINDIQDLKRQLNAFNKKGLAKLLKRYSHIPAISHPRM